MSGLHATLRLRPAVLRPVRRRDVAIAAAVLVSSAAGGALVALFQPDPPVVTRAAAVAVPLPIPTLVRAAPVPAALPFDLAPIIEEGGLRVVVETAVEPQWLGKAIEVRDDDGVRVVDRELGETGAARFSGLIGARLRLFGAAAELCIAEVRGVSAVGRFAPDDLGEADAPVDTAAAWEAAGGSHLIAGSLAVIEGDCTGALWAQPEGDAPPVQAVVAKAGPGSTRRAAALLEQTAEYAEVAGSGDVKVSFEATSISTETETLLVASALVEGCADFEPLVTAVYAVQPDGALHPVGSGFQVSSIAAAADFDGDGHLEILVQRDTLDSSILRRRAGDYREEAHAAVPIYGCRC